MNRCPGSSSRLPRRTGRWAWQDARARFGAFLRRVHRDGPQQVTIRGRKDVVVMSADDFRRLRGPLTGEVLIALMKASPHPEVEIEPTRMPFPVRDVSL